MSMSRRWRRRAQAEMYGWDSTSQSWWRRSWRRERPRLTAKELAQIEKQIEKEMAKMTKEKAR